MKYTQIIFSDGYADETVSEDTPYLDSVEGSLVVTEVDGVTRVFNWRHIKSYSYTEVQVEDDE